MMATCKNENCAEKDVAKDVPDDLVERVTAGEHVICGACGQPTETNT